MSLFTLLNIIYYYILDINIPLYGKLYLKKKD